MEVFGGMEGHGIVMTRYEFIERLNNRKLVIRGAGVFAKNFYEKYGHILGISYCTSNHAEECIEGLTRIELEQILEQKNEYFIIVCVGDYEAVSFQLISEGLMPEVDFAPAKLVGGCIENKKILLAVGQCELEVTDYIFQHMPQFNENYITLYYDEYKVLGIMDKKPLLQCIMEVNALIQMADYFIYPINLSTRCDYYNRLLTKVQPDCRTVGVSLSTFEGYWPQDNVKDYYEKSPYYLTPDSQRLRRDRNLEMALEEGGEEGILQHILEENFYDEAFVHKCLEKTIKKIEIMERKADVKISDYYRKYYKTKKLFLDRGHAAAFVLREYAKRILESCEIDFEIEEIDAVDLDWYDECHMEFPIYPSVRKVLDLKDDGKYRMIQNEKIMYFNFEEYMEVVYRKLKKGFEYLGKD